MAKKNVVKFFGGDAKKPSKTGTMSVELHMPFPMNLHPSSPVNIDLGLTCNCNLIVGSTKIKLSKNVFLAGEKIILEGLPTVTSPTLVDANERIAVALPHIPADFEIE